MMNEYSLCNMKVEIPSFAKSRDSKGKAYYNYQIVATSPSPFNRWKVDRRFGQFAELFAFFSGSRRIQSPFPRPSLMEFSLSKGKLAKQRIKPLENFLIELLSFNDLRVPELEQLHLFLNVELTFEDKDSDFGDVRRELFPAGDYYGENEGSLIENDDPRAEEGTGDDVVSISSDDIVKLTSSFNSEFRPTDDLNADWSTSPSRVLLSAASFRQGSDTKEMHYNVTIDGMKEALRNNDKKAVGELLKKGKALATQVDDAGNPMIYTAALYGAIELGIALIVAGADPHAVNRQGISAMDIAFDPWREAIQKYIDQRDEAKLNKCRYETLVTIVTKGPSGSIGLNIVRTTDNMPLVLGFTSPADGSEPAAAKCIPAIKPNDIIIAVNGTNITDLPSAVTLIKGAEKDVELTISRQVLVLNS